MLEYDQIPKHKVVLIGDVAVGKTSIIRRFISQNYEDNYVVNLYS